MIEGEQPCPLTGATANVVREKSGSHNYLVNSPCAGGEFYVVRSVFAKLPDLELAEKRSIVEFIIGRTRLGLTTHLDSETLARAMRWPLLNVTARANRLLSYLAGICPFVGMQKKVSPIEYGLARANAGALRNLELNFMLNFLAADHLIEMNHRPDGELDSFYIEPAGYRHLERLSEPGSDKVQGFIAMWFDRSLDDVVERGFAPAIAQAGWSPLRIDQKDHANRVDDEIIGEIRRSRFVVCDFTSERDKARGGVYFEAGFAYGLGIPVIWTCRHDLIDQVHFDTRQFNHITWTDAVDLRDRLTRRILRVVGEGPLTGESQGR